MNDVERARGPGRHARRPITAGIGCQLFELVEKPAGGRPAIADRHLGVGAVGVRGPERSGKPSLAPEPFPKPFAQNGNRLPPPATDRSGYAPHLGSAFTDSIENPPARRAPRRGRGTRSINPVDPVRIGPRLAGKRSRRRGRGRGCIGHERFGGSWFARRWSGGQREGPSGHGRGWHGGRWHGWLQIARRRNQEVHERHKRHERWWRRQRQRLCQSLLGIHRPHSGLMPLITRGGCETCRLQLRLCH